MIKERDGRGRYNACCKKKARKAANINNVVIANREYVTQDISSSSYSQCTERANVLDFKA